MYMIRIFNCDIDLLQITAIVVVSSEEMFRRAPDIFLNPPLYNSFQREQFSFDKKKCTTGNSKSCIQLSSILIFSYLVHNSSHICLGYIDIYIHLVHQRLQNRDHHHHMVMVNIEQSLLVYLKLNEINRCHCIKLNIQRNMLNQNVVFMKVESFFL